MAFPWASEIANIRHSQQRGFTQVTNEVRSVGVMLVHHQKLFGLMNDVLSSALRELTGKMGEYCL